MVVYTITPVYSGDDNYQGTTGQPITFNVLNSPAVLLTSAPSAINVTGWLLSEREPDTQLRGRLWLAQLDPDYV